MEWSDSKQRWAVNVDERKDLVRVKPGNLELVRPGPDEPRYWPAGVHISELVFDIDTDSPVAKLARREGQPRPLTDEELRSHVLFSGGLIDLRGAFKLTTVVSVYSAAAYEGEAWKSELNCLTRYQQGLSPNHWKLHVGVTANDGNVEMVACAPWRDMMFCGHEPKRFGWQQYEPFTEMGKTLGIGGHETWMSKGNTGGAWTVKDLCEIVLGRYRVKRTDKPGSWLFGARVRVAVDDDLDNPDPEKLPTLLKLTQYCGNSRWGAWAIVGGLTPSRWSTNL